MSDPDFKSSEADKDDEEWKCERRLGQKNGGTATEHFPAQTLLDCSKEKSCNTTEKKPVLSPLSTESLLDNVCMNGEKSGSGGGGGGKSVEAGKETRPAVSSSSIRLPTAAKGTSRNRKEAGIPVGIAVVWQRLAPAASTTPPLNSKACNTMSSTKSISPPLLVKSTPKIKAPSHSPVPKRPSSTSSAVGGGTKEKIREKWGNNDSAMMTTDVKCRPSPAQSVPLNPHGMMASSKLSEQHSPHSYGGSLKYTTDWLATGLNVPTSLSSQNYNAAAAAYLHHQHQLQQQQHLQQQHHLQQQQQLQQLHHMSHASHHFGAHPATQSLYAGYPPPDVLHKYEQYLFQHQAELARQQELQYHHHLHQLHNLSQQQQQQQQLHPEYDIHRATPIPSPRINIPSPSPTLHGLHHPHVTPTTTAALWSPEILHHHTSATLSPKSLASTPSPVSAHDSSFLCNPPKANLSAKATTTRTVVPHGASSTSPPVSRAATTTDWKDMKINPVPKKVAMSWTTTTVIKKNEKLDSPPVMEGDAVHSNSGKEKSITKKKHDFTRLESLIEKRDDVPLLSPVPIKIDTESCAGNESKPSVPNSHQLQPITTGPDYLRNSNCGRSEWPTGIGGSPVDLKPMMNNDPVKIKRETENCDVPLKIGVVADGVSNLVPEMKIKSHVIKCESVNSVADSSVNKSAQVLPIGTTKAEPVGTGSSLITNEKKPKKLHSQELKNPRRPVCFAKHHNGVNNNNDNVNSNNSTKLVKEPILTKSFKQEKNTSPIMMIIPGAGPMTVADSHQNNNSSSSSNSNDSNYNDSHPMMLKQDKTNSKFERNSVTSTVTTPLSQPLEQKCDFQSQSPPLTKCDTDIKIVAPHSLSYSLINKNNNNSDTINDTSRPRSGDAENGYRRRRDGDDDHDDEYQEQKIIGNICTTNRSNYHHLVNVPLNQSPHSSLLASSSVCKKIKSENVGDISSSTTCTTADDRDTLSRFHHQDNNPPPDYRPIIVQAADSSNHLDLLATVAQQFGNEIGLRKKPFTTTTTTTVSTVTSATKAFDDEYEFKEESSVPDRNSNKTLEPCGPFSAMNDDDEEDADEESLPSLPNSRSSSPFLTTPISSILAKFPPVKSGQAPPPPTVAPLVLRIPQVSPGDTPSSAAATGTEKKLKKPKSKRNKKDNENKIGNLLGMVKKKKKKKSSSSKPGQDKPKLKKGSRANENLLTVTSSSSSLGSSDRAEKAMKKSKKENVDELWQLGELKVAPLKLTKRRSTSDAIVMKKGTGSLVSRDKIKKQRYSIESSSIPCIWSSSPETGMRADAKLDKHSSTKAVDSKKQPSFHKKTPGLLAMGQSSRIIQKKKKKNKKQAEDEDRKKPTSSSSSLLSEQPNTLSQDLSKKKKKKSKNHPDLSCNFHNNLGPSASVGSGEGAGCDNERDDDNDTFEPGQEVFSPASSNVENDWAANPTYAVTAIKTTSTVVTDSTPILAPSNTDDNSNKISHPQQQEKKLKASKLTPANLNNVESTEGTGGGKLQKNINKSYIKSSPSLVQEVTPSKKTKQQNGQHHIKPCLKAEPIRRSSTSPQNDFISSEDDEKDTDENIDISTKYSSDTQIEPVVKEKVVEKSVKIESVDEMINDMRVLTEIQGLFYTGKLNALQPPDVYGVTLDNERGAPPHIIFSAEEVLEKCIRELKPEPEALVHGLRICAYWSPQYSGLYPGKISPDYIPSGDPYNELIPIEFDDGDTGVIKLNEIRLLSPDHPKGEYDPNPLLTLEKKHRKRRHSSAAGSQTSGCTGDHEETDCGEPYCAKMGKLEEDEGGKSKSKLLYWTWKGLSLKKNNRSKKDRNKDFFEGIQRGDEVISVGDSALFTSSGNDRPFIGRVEKFWEKKGQKIVKVRWYYHPDEVKTNKSLKGLYAGSLFESPHIDENDVQTIAKKCEVLPFAEFKERVGCLTKWSRNTSQRGIYFVSGFYNPYTYNLQLKDLK